VSFVAGNAITRVIAPRHEPVRGKPFDDVSHVEWLPLEERFMLHGDGISYIDGGDGRTASTLDPSTPVHGPFAQDFGWVTLVGWPHGPIQLSDRQSALFRLLWDLNGATIQRDRLMSKLGSGSDRPMDLVKLKAGQKGKSEYEGPLAAYKKLIVVTRGGDYSMPRGQSLPPVP
jgi:hypothetical protein